MFELRSFGLTDILQCSSQLRRVGAGTTSLESAARAVVRYLHGNLVDKETNESALALVRLYKTHRFAELEPDLQEFAQKLSPARELDSDSACITLLASAGDDESWNDRHASRHHKAIPLADAATTAPMLHELISAVGITEGGEGRRPTPQLLRQRGSAPGRVFFVEKAAGSEYVPDQEFVERHGIRSVLGFGGLLPSGYVFAVVAFSKVAVPRDTAEAFSTLAFAAQLPLLPHVERRLFDSDPPLRPRDDELDLAIRVAQSEIAALSHLLDIREDVITDQAMRLEQALQEAQDRAEALERSQRRLEQSEATKTAILDAALDCIITMDSRGTIVDFNTAAETTFGYSKEQALGQELAALIIPPRYRDAHREALARFLATREGDILDRRIEISAVRRDGAEFPVELAVSAVEAAGSLVFTGHIRDITDRKRVETEMQAARDRYAEVARTLQASLLPAAVPEIPGFEVGHLYRPGLEGLDVGGDFYDVFEVRRGKWGVVLGDVMGKGAEAAAMTSLARHTVRAAAIGARRPAAVLRLLNEALYREDTERFCTAAFAFVDVGATPRISFCSGGHPPPLLRTAAGVTELASVGSLLGPFTPWDGKDSRVALAAGDLVLFYSDGVTEARHGNELFGAERLVDALAATAGMSSWDTVDAIAATVSTFASEPSDDIAIIALRVVPPPGDPAT